MELGRQAIRKKGRPSNSSCLHTFESAFCVVGMKKKYTGRRQTGFSSYQALTSSEQSALAPIHGQQDPRPETDALREIHAPPQVHGHQAAAETQPVEIEHGRVADVGEAA